MKTNHISHMFMQSLQVQLAKHWEIIFLAVCLLQCMLKWFLPTDLKVWHRKTRAAGIHMITWLLWTRGISKGLAICTLILVLTHHTIRGHVLKLQCGNQLGPDYTSLHVELILYNNYYSFQYCIWVFYWKFGTESCHGTEPRYKPGCTHTHVRVHTCVWLAFITGR